VLPAKNVSAPDAMQRFAKAVQAVAPDASGPPASITGAGEAVLSAFVEAIIYTVVAVASVIAILRRNLSDVLLVLAPLAVASIWTVAASAALDLPFNFANVIVVPLLIGLGVAANVHIVVRARDIANDLAGTQGDGTGVLDTSTPLAVLLAQLNTVAAFATLAVSHHRGLYSMGVLLGLSIFFVLIVSLIVLPAFMIAMGVGGGWRGVPPATTS
jgi:predicted RND superfamily exporter protein